MPLDLFALEREARRLSHQFQAGEREAVADALTAYSAAAAAVMAATIVADWMDGPADRGQSLYDLGYLVAALARRTGPDYP